MAEKMREIIRTNPFVRGMIRVIDLGCRLDQRGTIGVKNEDATNTAWNAIGEDWRKVGGDLNRSFERYRKEFVRK